ncbi:FAS1-like dehydratase domain-containing protein [Hoeflea poritis]|uniref:MaoC family dehydratase N-terminal domain-containing protein n=1 Tax=Hoeflea poritis TaxID=2993659 RepID=A0ABT4VIC3_9HYPH|nr:MaoC family dehydratase N-terminal domain-containing protein [Hoeflea poritis]MDA4844436.1 MaoC family dehydratase N-terminal domain-containing protein [Hoeflea poritis]
MPDDRSEELDLDYLNGWIGREETVSDVVTPELVRRFNATLDIGAPPPEIGAPAPLLVHLCLAPSVAATGELGPDGHPPRGDFVPPVPLPRRMWAGGELEFFDDLRIGDRVERHSRVADIAVKQGRSGALCFVTVEHRISVDARPVLTEIQNIVYRGPSDPSRGAGSPQPAKSGEHSRRIRVTAPLLFRYSALMFNGHRIHYDRAYATGTEGYPGLVVHGPLQATLLLHFAAELNAGRSPSRFTFRSKAPLFDDGDFILHAAQDGDVLHLWTAREGGPAAMEATAYWS